MQPYQDPLLIPVRFYFAQRLNLKHFNWMEDADTRGYNIVHA